MFNSEKAFNFNNEENYPDPKKELEGELKNKTFTEKHFAEFQTKEAPLRGVKNPEQTRGEAFRFERGQFVKAYQILRQQIAESERKGEDTSDKQELLEKIRNQAEVWTKKLDELER